MAANMSKDLGVQKRVMMINATLIQAAVATTDFSTKMYHPSHVITCDVLQANWIEDLRVIYPTSVYRA